jgi:hypothetical protein
LFDPGAEQGASISIHDAVTGKAAELGAFELGLVRDESSCPRPIG